MPQLSGGPPRPESLHASSQPNSESALTSQYDKDVIQRGFTGQNSFSNSDLNNEESNVAFNPEAKPSIDAPLDGADSPNSNTVREIMGIYKQEFESGEFSDIDIPFSQALGLTAIEFMNNPMAGMIETMGSNQEHLVSQGFSPDTINTLMMIADPKSKHNLSNMHSFSDRLDGVLTGNPSIYNAYEAFTDVFNKVSNIKSGPQNLIRMLEDNLRAFTESCLKDKSFDADQATIMLMQIQTMLMDNRLVFEQESIKAQQVVKQEASEKRMKAILKSINKAKKAKKSGLVGKIFGYIAVALMAVVAAVMVATAVVTGGATLIAAAVLMCVAASLVTMLTVSNETGGWAMQMFGKSKNAKWAAMGFYMGVILVCSIGAGFAAGVGGSAGTAASTASTGASAAAGGGAAAGGAAAAGTGATVTASATAAANAAAASAAKFQAILSKMTLAVNLASGATQVAGSIADIFNTKYTYEAAMLKVTAKEFYAEIVRIQQYIDDSVESIQRVIDEFQNGFSIIMAILKDNHDTKTKLAQNLRA